MEKKHEQVIASILGDDFIEDLKKSDNFVFYKKNSNTSLDPDEIKIALQIVPRAVLSYLFANLVHSEVGGVYDLELPFVPGALLHVNKCGADNYNGEIQRDGKVLYDFKHRSLPGIGLILLTTFELYDVSLLDEIKTSQQENPIILNKINNLQHMIDDRLNLNQMIQEVVDKKLSERDAIDRLIKERMNWHVMSVNNSEVPMHQEDKKSKLRTFLDRLEHKKRNDSYIFDKSEIHCQDCGTVLYKTEDKSIKLCICYGQFHNKEISLKKSEDGKIKLNFPKSFDIENIEMLLETLKNTK